mgnify:CR=1 FL=1
MGSPPPAKRFLFSLPLFLLFVIVAKKPTAAAFISEQPVLSATTSRKSIPASTVFSPPSPSVATSAYSIKRDTLIFSLSATLLSSDSNNNNNGKKGNWEVFWDLECPFARKHWEQFPALRETFQDQFDFSIHLTSLAFHPRAWIGQCAAFLIRRERGEPAWLDFINACYTEQDLYKDDLLGKDPRPSEVAAVFADIASRANIFSDTFTRDYFLEHVMDWKEIIKPTYQEHKYALEKGVFGTPKHVINGELVPDTESSWGVVEWQEKLKSMGLWE